jgi:hypothetical protein
MRVLELGGEALTPARRQLGALSAACQAIGEIVTPLMPPAGVELSPEECRGIFQEISGEYMALRDFVGQSWTRESTGAGEQQWGPNTGAAQLHAQLLAVANGTASLALPRELARAAYEAQPPGHIEQELHAWGVAELLARGEVEATPRERQAGRWFWEARERPQALRDLLEAAGLERDTQAFFAAVVEEDAEVTLYSTYRDAVPFVLSRLSPGSFSGVSSQSSSPPRSWRASLTLSYRCWSMRPWRAR